jgi:hypothetical protein
MFTKFVRKLQTLNSAPVPFDPARYGDPLATTTAWTPLKRGGANFRDYKLVKTSVYRLEFRATAQAVLFYSVFLLGGLVPMIGITYSNISKGTLGLNADTIIPLVLGAIFAAVGGVMLYFETIPVVFDRMRGCFWKGHGAPAVATGKAALKSYAEFSRIHALQIISELCRGKKNSTYYSYELNLVLDDGQRINVADHGNLQKLREDAVTLSQFLGKPLWDATS